MKHNTSVQKNTLLKIKWLFMVLFLVAAAEMRAQCGPIISTFPYTEGFESSAAWTSGGTNSDWAWGSPTHPLINSAGGGTQCWCIGGLSGTSYLNSEQSWIMSPCFDFTSLNYPWVSFKLFWECERTWDGMTFQYSLDGGLTWANVGAFNDPVNCLNQNWFNISNITYLNSLPAGTRQGWSGRVGASVGPCAGTNGSGAWVTAMHCMSNLANQSNVRFRFLFGSGTTCNAYDGIAVDDILIGNAPVNVANFSWSCAGTNVVNFTNLSASCPTGYSWNFGDPASGGNNTSVSASPSHTFTGPGTYTVTLTSSGPCNAPGTISMPVTILGSSATVVNVNCNGAGNGSATVNVTGGSGPYTYTWSPSGGTGPTENNLAPGTYTVNVSQAGACPASTVVTITEPFLLTATQSQTNSNCNGNNNGSATVVPAGGTGPYTYVWTPSGGTAATATGLSPTSYTCTITDVNGCTTTQVFTITEPPVLTASSANTGVSCNGGSDGSASVSVSGGTGPYFYIWSPVGGTGPNATGLQAGTYTCAIADASGCNATQTVIITQPPAFTVTATQVDATCNAGNNGSATVNVAGGTPGYTYSWSPSGGTAATASGLTAGTHTSTITDANNCTTQQLFTITEPVAMTTTVTTTPATCGNNNGTAGVTLSGGNGPFTYAWSPSGGNASSASNLAVGFYTVLITGTDGCSVSATASVQGSGVVVVNVANVSGVSCGNGSDGAASVAVSGGTAPYTYLWAPAGGNNANATGLTAGTYTCTVTDVNGCVTTQTVSVPQPAGLTVVPSQTNTTCNGSGSGSAAVVVSGGYPNYTYQWSPSGGTNATATGLPAGTYTCSITDANGCTATQTFSITQPSAISLATTATAVTCFGGNDGSATVTANGGTPGYTYNWLPSGGNGATANNLQAGLYAVIVTDANGCSDTTSVSVIQPATPVTASTSSIPANCNGNGTASVSASGGTGSYTYMWAPNAGTGSTISALPGTYTVTATDANGCTGTQTITIGQNNTLAATANAANALCFGTATGTATVTPTSGTAPYTYNWSPSGGTNATATGLIAGTYTCSVTDANGCTNTQTITITQPAAIVLNAGGDSICPGTAAQLNAGATGGTGTITYLWSNGGTGASQVVTAAQTTTYTVTATDPSGCNTTATAVVMVMPGPVAAFSTGAVNGFIQLNGGMSTSFCFNNTTAGATLWGWSLNGQPDLTFSPCVTFTLSDTGSYCATLAVQSANGCTDTAAACFEIINTGYSYPNVFTPNSDGINDYFLITSQGMQKLHCEVYDRWGAKISEWDNISGSWDGRNQNGTKCADGVYYFVAELTDHADIKIPLSGFVHLINGGK